jgi:L-serine dehydratase
MPFTSLTELIERAEKEQTTIAQIMLTTEMEQKGLSKDQLIKNMAFQLDVMEEAVRKGTSNPVTSRTGLNGGDAPKKRLYNKNAK